MSIDRSVSRVLAAAVASAGFAAVPVPSIGATLTCTASSFNAVADSSGNINVSCNTPGTTVGTCTISVSPSALPSSGGNVTITTNCGANTSLSGGKSLASNGSNSWSDTIPANTASTTVTYTYTVTGDGGTKSASVSEAGQGQTAPPPSGGPISCAGFRATHVLDIPWGAPSSAAPRVLTSSAGGFGNNEIVVGRFTTPASTAPGVFAVIKSAEWGDQQHLRTASLSQTPCDFSYPNPLGRLATTTVGTPSPSVNYAIGGTSTYYAILQPSTTYYFNIKNEASGVSTCAPGESCNMFIELQKPRGL